ncbi:MAG: 3-keto-L-gulonate-6-phosphate decarboxylase UlaD [Planctomycetes bacterium]|nr:3-keto-L-gulonate-6-phosphate decarboxylase UlaD [Planctomycetota bacterium]
MSKTRRSAVQRRITVQVALDFVDTSRALKCAREAAAGGADLLEVGTPLLKAEGLEAVRALHREFPKIPIVCDAKTMDAGRAEVEMAAKAGASIATVLGVASDETIQECIEAGRNYGIRVYVDLLGHPDPVARAKQAESWGAAFVGVHCPIDEQMAGKDPFERLRRVAKAVAIPVAVAGGIHSESAADAVAAGASVVIVGGFITKAEDATAATRKIRKAVDTGAKVATTLFKRGGGEDEIRAILTRVSVANVSDAFHRRPPLPGLRAIVEGARAAGPAWTVRTAPGDWAKPVEAIDHAPAGSVLVIDAYGAPPALWGELATHSAIQRKLAGVVIHGAIRDTPEIRKLRFPAWATHVCPHAGEPKGFGEENVALRIGGIPVEPGDWITADDDGVVTLPRAHAVEFANRAQDVLEKENRVRHEIDKEGRTLAEVVELYKWEKK